MRSHLPVTRMQCSAVGYGHGRTGDGPEAMDEWISNGDGGKPIDSPAPTASRRSMDMQWVTVTDGIDLVRELIGRSHGAATPKLINHSQVTPTNLRTDLPSLPRSACRRYPPRLMPNRCVLAWSPLALSSFVHLPSPARVP